MSGIDEKSALELTEQELRGLFDKNRGSKPSNKYVQPDFAMIQCQLEQYKGLTLMILWEEYIKHGCVPNVGIRVPFMHVVRTVIFDSNLAFTW